MVGSSLQPSDGGTFENRSVCTTAPVARTAFRTSFTFRVLPDASTGDGFTFIIRGVGNTATGGIGGALGSQGIAKSLAVKFDLSSSNGEGANSTGVSTNGATPTNVGSIDQTGSGINLHGGDPMTATITYDGPNLGDSIHRHRDQGHVHPHPHRVEHRHPGGGESGVRRLRRGDGRLAHPRLDLHPHRDPRRPRQRLPRRPGRRRFGHHPARGTDASPLAAGPDIGDGSATKVVSLGPRNQGNGTRGRLTATGVPSGSQGFSFALNRIKAARMITPPPQASMNFLAIHPT